MNESEKFTKKYFNNKIWKAKLDADYPNFIHGLNYKEKYLDIEHKIDKLYEALEHYFFILKNTHHNNSFITIEVFEDTDDELVLELKKFDEKYILSHRFRQELFGIQQIFYKIIFTKSITSVKEIISHIKFIPTVVDLFVKEVQIINIFPNFPEHKFDKTKDVTSGFVNLLKRYK